MTMRNRSALIGAVLAVGAVGALLAPAAMATTDTTTPTTEPTSTTSPPPTTTTTVTPPSLGWINVAPTSGRSGAAVVVDTGCPAKSFESAALDVNPTGTHLGDRWRYHAKVKDVKAGTYKVTAYCPSPYSPGGSLAFTTEFTVLPKAQEPPTKPQVPTKPVGAPQTGGGFTATDLVG
jgi:hypothetical protein